MQNELSSFKYVIIKFIIIVQLAVSIVTVAGDRMLTFAYDMTVTLRNTTVTLDKTSFIIQNTKTQNVFSDVYEIQNKNRLRSCRIL